jgi:hypothetical protein
MRCRSFREDVFQTSFSPDLGPTEQSWGKFATQIVTKTKIYRILAMRGTTVQKPKRKRIIKKMKN